MHASLLLNSGAACSVPLACEKVTVVGEGAIQHICLPGRDRPRPGFTTQFFLRSEGKAQHKCKCNLSYMWRMTLHVFDNENEGRDRRECLCAQCSLGAYVHIWRKKQSKEQQQWVCLLGTLEPHPSLESNLGYRCSWKDNSSVGSSGGLSAFG